MHWMQDTLKILGKLNFKISHYYGKTSMETKPNAKNKYCFFSSNIFLVILVKKTKNPHCCNPKQKFDVCKTNALFL